MMNIHYRLSVTELWHETRTHKYFLYLSVYSYTLPGQRLWIEVTDEPPQSELVDQFLHPLLILLFDLGPGFTFEGLWDVFREWQDLLYGQSPETLVLSHPSTCSLVEGRVQLAWVHLVIQVHLHIHEPAQVLGVAHLSRWIWGLQNHLQRKQV